MEKSQEESKLSPQDHASPHVIPGDTGRGEDLESEEREGRTGLEDDRQEIQGGGEETKVVLLPVNPHLVHVYWEISARDLEQVGGVFSRFGPRAQPVLRFYDTTRAESASVNSATWFEAAIALAAGKWYVRLENPAGSYCIDLGLRMPGDAFHRLARSNVAQMPKACPSDRLEERYLFVEGHHPPSEVVVAHGDGISGSQSAFPCDATQVPQEPFEGSGEASRTLPAYAEPQNLGESWPERRGSSEPVPMHAAYPGEEGNVAADQRVSQSRPPYDEWQDDGGIDRVVEGARPSRALLSEDAERQLTELYDQRRWERVWWEPGVRGRKESRTATKTCADLTELSERSFRAGLSSGQKLP